MHLPARLASSVLKEGDLCVVKRMLCRWWPKRWEAVSQWSVAKSQVLYVCLHLDGELARGVPTHDDALCQQEEQIPLTVHKTGQKA
jgi:hypothetical protein